MIIVNSQFKRKILVSNKELHQSICKGFKFIIDRHKEDTLHFSCKRFIVSIERIIGKKLFICYIGDVIYYRYSFLINAIKKSVNDMGYQFIDLTKSDEKIRKKIMLYNIEYGFQYQNATCDFILKKIKSNKQEMKTNDKIKDLRTKLSLTQEQFARIIGTTRSNYAQIELGNVKPSLSIISKICKRLNVKPSEFINLENEEQEQVIQDSTCKFDFKIGDVVKLKGQHFSMTIDEVLNTSSICVFFNENNKLVYREFKNSLLEYVKKDDDLQPEPIQEKEPEEPKEEETKEESQEQEPFFHELIIANIDEIQIQNDDNVYSNKFHLVSYVNEFLKEHFDPKCTSVTAKFKGFKEEHNDNIKSFTYHYNAYNFKILKLETDENSKRTLYIKYDFLTVEE